MDAQKIVSYLKQRFDKYKYVLIVCLAGLALVSMPSSGRSETAAQADAHDDVERLESRLEEILSRIDGVGRARVVLTAKSGRASVYAYNEDKTVSQNGAGSSADSRTTLASSGSSGGQQPVTVRVDEPQYRGALVVCDGADSARVRLEGTKAVTSLTGVSSDNVVVAKMK